MIALHLILRESINNINRGGFMNVENVGKEQVIASKSCRVQRWEIMVKKSTSQRRLWMCVALIVLGLSLGEGVKELSQGYEKSLVKVAF